MKENTRKNPSHLIHVDSLPDNCVQITHYGKHQFDNLYFCKSNNKLYQKFKYRIREIPLFNENGEKIISYSYIRTTDKKSIPVAPAKILRMYEKLEKKN